MSIDIIQGTERTNLDIAVMNNSKLKFPENSLLVCDTKKSLLTNILNKEKVFDADALINFYWIDYKCCCTYN